MPWPVCRDLSDQCEFMAVNVMDQGAILLKPNLAAPFFFLFFFLSNTGLCQSIASPAVMCTLKVVTVSALGVIKTIIKQQIRLLKLKLYTYLVCSYNFRFGFMIDVIVDLTPYGAVILLPSLVY